MRVDGCAKRLDQHPDLEHAFEYPVVMSDRFSDTHEPPEGYRWIGDGPGIVLIDPDWCPNGEHPFMIASRDAMVHCTDPKHRQHDAWTCRCGQRVYRFNGAFWGSLPCIRPRRPA